MPKLPNPLPVDLKFEEFVVGEVLKAPRFGPCAPLYVRLVALAEEYEKQRDEVSPAADVQMRGIRVLFNNSAHRTVAINQIGTWCGEDGWQLRFGRASGGNTEFYLDRPDAEDGDGTES